MQNLKRILNFAMTDFARNKGLGLASIFVLTITVFLVSWLFFVRGTSNYLVSQVQDKIDITAYFKEDAPENDILKAKDEILRVSPDIKEVQYISKDQAIENFRQRHQDSDVLIRALEEVGDNPFLPSLNITTSGALQQYEEISNLLQTSQYSKLIDKVDFSQKRDTIEKVYAITTNVNRFGLALGALLVIIAVLVVFNTVKLAIDRAKDELTTMRLVGASDWFVKGPFIIQGAFYGLVAFLICLLVCGFGSYLLSSKLSLIMPGFDLFEYFINNLWIFLILQLLFSVGLGVASSLVVVRKNLED